MHSLILGAVVLGVLGGTAAKARTRPFLKTVVKYGITTERKLRKVAESVKTEWNTIVTEAQTELDATHPGA